MRGEGQKQGAVTSVGRGCDLDEHEQKCKWVEPPRCSNAAVSRNLYHFGRFQVMNTKTAVSREEEKEENKRGKEGKKNERKKKERDQNERKKELITNERKQN